ncbi:hypothetical protein NC796_03550 [Aliifodinibius sp. S!AR15-10]|uniref:glycoside hydrolase family 2 protein n=1 Tax=Aliifodinibius sp. S!AR15-10 TaxID=2950437 RepID=UPI00285A874B|nr:glycoside hydrolase family 2 TIM barrel-domain containing protein [Aliifodinibius sp. S!AR15-10]MDR8390202.1 hypothetical protein [Aliifodinibius sp. S!AR15-10]
MAIQSASGEPNAELRIPIPNQKLWSPDNPFLYDLEISLMQNGTTVDQVSSYFGMRKISVEEEDGQKKLFLNNEFLFQMGPLDQGYWPDGIYTATTDEALKYDLEVTKQLGFNMVRKHLKVEPQRWYYWADKLGLLVWQDMPSPNSYTPNTPPVETEAFERELKRMVRTHWNSPSIIMWVIFNEGQGQHKTAELVQEVEQLDSSRLVYEASGWDHVGQGDVLDIHSYPAPASPDTDTQAKAVGEYGGIGYGIEGHLWQDGFGYVKVDSDREYNELYDRFAKQLTAFKTNDGRSEAVYTQTTDVETELNGLMTYDRAVIKGDMSEIKQSNMDVIRRNLYLSELLPTSQVEGRTWAYTSTGQLHPTGMLQILTLVNGKQVRGDLEQRRRPVRSFAESGIQVTSG